MARFFLGFLVATVVYGGVIAGLHAKGWVAFGAPEPAAVELAEAPPEVDSDPKKPKKKRPQRPRTERPSGAGSLPNGNATTGDDLDWNGERQVDMAGGEEQLSGSEIEAGFDSAMAKIRRCLILVPADGEVTGKLIFGMKVASDGTPRAVNLSGPAVVTTGESGDCLRKAAQAIRFAKFSGPDMLFKYPITLQ
ncbi:MAG TPA: hypothetical protein VI299_12435 [Polyangiales bacterium]